MDMLYTLCKATNLRKFVKAVYAIWLVLIVPVLVAFTFFLVLGADTSSVMNYVILYVFIVLAQGFSLDILLFCGYEIEKPLTKEEYESLLAVQMLENMLCESIAILLAGPVLRVIEMLVYALPF